MKIGTGKIFVFSFFLYIFLFISIALSQSLIKEHSLENNIYSILSPPNIEFVYCGLENGELVKFNNKDWERCQSVRLHQKSINDVSLFDSYLFTSSSDGSINIFNIDENNSTKSILINSKWLFCNTISCDGNYLITAGSSGEIIIIDWKKGKILRKIDAHNDWINDVLLYDNSQKIVSISNDNCIKIHDFTSGKLLKSFVLDSDVTSSCITSNHEKLVCGTESGDIIFISLNSLGIIHEIQLGNKITAIEISDNGIYVFASSMDGSIKIINSNNYEIVNNFIAHQSSINTMAKSDTSNILITTAQDKRIKIWDISNYRIKNQIIELLNKKSLELKKLNDKFVEKVNTIKSEMVRGEFETERNYNERKMKLFDDITLLEEQLIKDTNEYEQFIDNQLNTLTRIKILQNNIDFEIGKYNADQECFLVLVDDQNYRLTISIEEARQFKENLNSIVCNAMYQYDIDAKKKLFSLEFITQNNRKYYIGNQIYDNEMSAPPSLCVDVNFIDQTKNNILEACEKAEISVRIKNNGNGSAYGLSTYLIPEKNYDFLEFEAEKKIYYIKPEEEKEVFFNILSSKQTPSQECKFFIKFREDNGFEPQSQSIGFSTKKFETPELSFDSDFNDDNRKIEKDEIIEVTTQIINRGGPIFDVKTNINFGENVFLTSDSSIEQNFNEIPSNFYKVITFKFYVNEHVDENIPLSLKISASNYHEEYFDYSFKFNKTDNDPSIIVIDPIQKQEEIPELIPDVDKNIPEIDSINAEAVAVIIGNRRYVDSNIGDVTFAINDANSIKNYLIKCFGYKSENILDFYDISKLELVKIFGDELNYKGRLYDYVKKEKSDVFIYYSGHGILDVNSNKPYIVPVDYDDEETQLTGYSLETLYKNLAKINYKSLTLIIDACYTGVLDASPVVPIVENPVFTKTNYIVMTSSSANQVASWYPEKRHSLFTYYLLKGFQGDANLNNDDYLEFEELKEYLEVNVQYMANKLRSRNQMPEILSDNNRVFISY